MRFLHTADLHIGKIVNDFSMLEEQAFILTQIKNIAVEKKVDGIILAGDIYDRAIPSGEAVLLLNDFLVELVKAGIYVYMISGNHDSPERLSFLEDMLKEQGIGIGSIYQENLTVFEKEDDFGKVEVVLLPFCKPSMADAATNQEAVEKLLKNYWEQTDKSKRKRRVLVTHYFVTDAGREPELSDSETTVHVGGLDQVDASAFAGFDYVALGHIHKPQQIGEKPIYYAGSPLKYSFGEVKQVKSVWLVELDKEGLSLVEACPLRPRREMRKVRGKLETLLEQAQAEGSACNDYIQAILTNKEELIDPIGTLRSVYPNIMQIVKEEKTKETEFLTNQIVIGKKEPLSLFEEFYQLVQEEELTKEEKEIMIAVLKRAENM